MYIAIFPDVKLLGKCKMIMIDDQLEVVFPKLCISRQCFELQNKVLNLLWLRLPDVSIFVNLALVIYHMSDANYNM